MRQQRQSKDAWEKILTELSDYPGTQSEFCSGCGITLTSLRYQLSRRGRRERSEAERSELPSGAFVAVGRAGHSLEGGGGGMLGRRQAIEMSIGPITLRVWPDTDLAALRMALQAAVEACGRT